MRNVRCSPSGLIATSSPQAITAPPGMVWTPRVSVALGEEGLAEQSANSPLGTVAKPADIAAALLFLTSDLAGYISGQTLVVDGGVGVKFPYPMRL